MNEFFSLFILFRSGIKYFGQFSTFEALNEFLCLEYQKAASDGFEHDIVCVQIDKHEKDGFYI